MLNGLQLFPQTVLDENKGTFILMTIHFISEYFANTSFRLIKPMFNVLYTLFSSSIRLLKGQFLTKTQSYLVVVAHRGEIPA